MSWKPSPEAEAKRAMFESHVDLLKLAYGPAIRKAEEEKRKAEEEKRRREKKAKETLATVMTIFFIILIVKGVLWWFNWFNSGYS